jgi:hypothetical protein
MYEMPMPEKLDLDTFLKFPTNDAYPSFVTVRFGMLRDCKMFGAIDA